MKKLLSTSALVSYVTLMSLAPVGASAQISERSECEQAAYESCNEMWRDMGYSSSTACYTDQVQPICNDGGGSPPSQVPLPGGYTCHIGGTATYRIGLTGGGC